MKNNNNLINRWVYTKPVLSLSLLYSLLIIVLLLITHYVFNKPYSYFLRDDGQYIYGQLFFEGKKTLLHMGAMPGLVVMFSWFNFFPVSLHPFFRIATSLIFLSGSIWLARIIFVNFLDNKEFFWAGLISICNPVIIHWTLKTSPELYITFFIAVTYLLYKKIVYSHTYFDGLLLLMITILGSLIKPVLFLIPVFFFFYALILKDRKLMILFFLLLISNFIIMTSFMTLMKDPNNPSQSYGSSTFIFSTYLSTTVIKSGRFAKETPTMHLENNKNSNFYKAVILYKSWFEKYKSKSMNNSESRIILDFIKENPGLVILAQAAKPVFFFSLAARPFESYGYLLINGIFIALAVFQLKKWYKYSKKGPLFLIFVLLGYSLVYVLIHSFVRYSFPVMFFIGFIAGARILSIVQSFFNKKSLPR